MLCCNLILVKFTVFAFIIREKNWIFCVFIPVKCVEFVVMIGEYVTLACRELSFATEVVTALHSILAQDSESLHHLVDLSQLLSTACLSLHSGGRLHQYISTTQTSIGDSNHEGNSSSHCQPSDVDNTTACTELRNFSSVCFLVLRDEVLGLGVENTSCKKLFQVSFEYCICPDNYNEVPGEMKWDREELTWWFVWEGEGGIKGERKGRLPSSSGDREVENKKNNLK